MNNMNVQELVEAVKRHARAHYNEGGWDVVVEAWEDQEIADRVVGSPSVEEAIARFEPLVSVWADHQAGAHS